MLLLLLLLFTMPLWIRFEIKRFLLPVMNDDLSGATTEHIWRELSDRLRRFVRSRIDSSADVDDVLQTVFLRIHSNLDRLQDADRLESWVFQIARNAVTDHFRKQRTADGDVESLIADADDADTESVQAELAGCLNSLVERLPEDQRRALSLYEFDRLSQSEIATRESISLSGAKSRIQRGRRSLETLLRACCEFQFDGRGNVMEYEVAEADCCDDKCR